MGMSVRRRTPGQRHGRGRSRVRRNDADPKGLWWLKVHLQDWLWLRFVDKEVELEYLRWAARNAREKVVWTLLGMGCLSMIYTIGVLVTSVDHYIMAIVAAFGVIVWPLCAWTCWDARANDSVTMFEKFHRTFVMGLALLASIWMYALVGLFSEEGFKGFLLGEFMVLPLATVLIVGGLDFPGYSTFAVLNSAMYLVVSLSWVRLHYPVAVLLHVIVTTFIFCLLSRIVNKVDRSRYLEHTLIKRNCNFLKRKMRQIRATDRRVERINRAKKVMISYKREDKEFAMAVTRMLRKAGFRVWIDIEIKPGHDWRNEIARVIKHSIAVIFIMSPAAVKSKYCREEIYFASNCKKNIFCVVHKDAISQLTGGLKLILSRKQWVRPKPGWEPKQDIEIPELLEALTQARIGHTSILRTDQARWKRLQHPKHRPKRSRTQVEMKRSTSAMNMQGLLYQSSSGVKQSQLRARDNGSHSGLKIRENTLTSGTKQGRWGSDGRKALEDKTMLKLNTPDRDKAYPTHVTSGSNVTPESSCSSEDESRPNLARGITSPDEVLARKGYQKGEPISPRHRDSPQKASRKTLQDSSDDGKSVTKRYRDNQSTPALRISIPHEPQKRHSDTKDIYNESKSRYDRSFTVSERPKIGSRGNGSVFIVAENGENKLIGYIYLLIRQIGYHANWMRSSEGDVHEKDASRIDKCFAVVFIVSKQSVTNDAAIEAIHYAHEASKPIIAINIEKDQKQCAAWMQPSMSMMLQSCLTGFKGQLYFNYDETLREDIPFPPPNELYRFIWDDGDVMLRQSMFTDGYAHRVSDISPRSRAGGGYTWDPRNVDSLRSPDGNTSEARYRPLSEPRESRGFSELRDLRGFAEPKGSAGFSEPKAHSAFLGFGVNVSVGNRPGDSMRHQVERSERSEKFDKNIIADPLRAISRWSTTNRTPPSTPIKDRPSSRNSRREVKAYMRKTPKINSLGGLMSQSLPHSPSLSPNIGPVVPVPEEDIEKGVDTGFAIAMERIGSTSNSKASGPRRKLVGSGSIEIVSLTEPTGSFMINTTQLLSGKSTSENSISKSPAKSPPCQVTATPAASGEAYITPHRFEEPHTLPDPKSNTQALRQSRRRVKRKKHSDKERRARSSSPIRWVKEANNQCITSASNPSSNQSLNTATLDSAGTSINSLTGALAAHLEEDAEKYSLEKYTPVEEKFSGSLRTEANSSVRNNLRKPQTLSSPSNLRPLSPNLRKALETTANAYAATTKSTYTASTDDNRASTSNEVRAT
ncbi:hypothetical protein AAMO2058_000408400 [Amorphochlora amoebiformis]